VIDLCRCINKLCGLNIVSLHSPERRDRGIVRVGRWGEAGEKNKRNWGRGKGRNEKGVFWIYTTDSVLLALIV